MPNYTASYGLSEKDFPSNRKEGGPEKTEKKLEKVVKGQVKQRQGGIGRKFRDAFVAEDVRTVGDSLIFDIIVPSLKEAFLDLVNNGLSMLLTGEMTSRRGYSPRGGGSSHVSYSRYYDDRRRSDSGSSPRRTVAAGRYNFSDIVFDSRNDAEDVLAALSENMVSYGVASVGDFYDLVGVDSAFTDYKWGWTDIRTAEVRGNMRNGFVIYLPKPSIIE